MLRIHFIFLLLFASPVFGLINQLEADGISWAWVNDASLQEAQLGKDGSINITVRDIEVLVNINFPSFQGSTIKVIAICHFQTLVPWI